MYTGSTKAGTAAPSTEQLLAWVAAAARIELTAREKKSLASGLMDTPPAAGSIVAESANKALGLTTLTLSNGVKVVLKPTDFANEQIYLGALRPGDITQFAQQEVVNARYANAVVAAVFAEIALMKEQGPLAADLAKVKQNWIQVHRRSLRENGYSAAPADTRRTV